MRKITLLIISALALSACINNGAVERQVAWDSMNYSQSVAPEPKGFMRMGK